MSGIQTALLMQAIRCTHPEPDLSGLIPIDSLYQALSVALFLGMLMLRDMRAVGMAAVNLPRALVHRYAASESVWTPADPGTSARAHRELMAA